jgi:hypothetical protein
MSGSETGNVLLFDADDTDPRKYMSLKADRAQRVRYPCDVGNTMKNVTEVVYASAGGAIPPLAVQFMTGRVLFAAGASGTIQLPTAAVIVQLLNNYYRQVLSRTATYTNSNTVGNRISNEIEVEFYNSTAATITLSVNTGLTLQGLAGSLAIPANTIAKYKFVIVTTNPAAVDIFPTYGSSSGSVMSLAPQAPTQLVDYNPATGQLGYVTDAVLSSTVSTTTNIMGWDPATSTPRKYVLADAAPQQLLTRNAATGAIVYSSASGAGAYPVGTTTSGGPIQIESNGTVAYRVSTPPLFQRSTGQVVPSGAAALVLFPTNVQQATTDCTYNAGIFTTETNNAYHVDLTITQAAVSTNCFYQIVYGSVVGSGAVIAASGPTDGSRTISLSAYLHMASLGGNTPPYTFHVECVNTSGGNVTIVSGVQSQIIVGYVRV